jgi:stalled ribosome alternative rescue factor ArfA
MLFGFLGRNVVMSRIERKWEAGTEYYRRRRRKWEYNFDEIKDFMIKKM